MKFIELQNQMNTKAGEIKGRGKHEIKSAVCKAINEILKENNIAAVAEYEYNERANYVRLYVANEHGWADRRNTHFAPYIQFKVSRELVHEKYHYYPSSNVAYYTFKSLEFISDDKEQTIESWIEEQAASLKKIEDNKNAEIEKVNKYIDGHPEFIEMYKLAKKHRYYLKEEYKNELYWA